MLGQCKDSFKSSALNYLNFLACEMQNEYLTEKSQEKIWTVSGPDFGNEQVKSMIVVRALYGLNLSGEDFRDLIDEQLHELGYMTSIADPDVWMIPEVKQGGFMYYEYVLCYVDDVLCISNDPICTMEVIQANFKLKGEKIEEPDMYLGA